MKKALTKYGGDVKSLTSEQIREIHEGRFGGHVPIDVIDDICQDLGIQIDLEAYEQYRAEILVTNQQFV